MRLAACFPSTSAVTKHLLCPMPIAQRAHLKYLGPVQHTNSDPEEMIEIHGPLLPHMTLE